VNEHIVSALLGVFPLIIPEVVLLVGACVLFLGTTFRSDRHLWGGVALLFLVAAGIALALAPLSPTEPPVAQATVFAGPLLVDRVAVFFRAVALVAAFILILASWDQVPDAYAAEYHGCILLIAAGLGLTGAANELITLFLALELISIPTYILLYLPRVDNPAQEAAMKYFLLSVFSSALLLFGFSYLYGLVGTTNLPALAQAMEHARGTGLPGTALVALVMLLAGLGFRITAFPFHFYAPDVYQGTSTGAAALLAFFPKAAGFAALLRVLGYIPHELTVQPGTRELLEGTALSDAVLGIQVPHLLWILAVLTMTLGNVLALLQDNVKRMLAYSSVAHAGYMLIGLVVARFQQAGAYTGSVDAVLFYVVAYGAMTVGAFTVLSYLSTPGRPVETVDDVAGLGTSHPGVALLLTLFLFSLIGIPLTAGFAGKLLLFWGAIAVEPAEPTTLRLFRVLALVAAVNAAIGAWYYLRLVAVMWLRNPLRPLPRPRAIPGLAALLLCAAITLVAGVYPYALLDPIRFALPQSSAGPAANAQVRADGAP
jgi:NADH-quinone oxidoreductase subunit N